MFHVETLQSNGGFPGWIQLTNESRSIHEELKNHLKNAFGLDDQAHESAISSSENELTEEVNSRIFLSRLANYL